MTTSRGLLLLFLCIVLQLGSLYVLAFLGPAAPAAAVPRSRRGGLVQVASSGMCGRAEGVWDSRCYAYTRKLTQTLRFPLPL